VEFYCSVVVGFNIFIGICRLFGLPVRDNFRYWLLARTPNEHWQRWNLLLREWVLTYAFFPIMRAKRWLFAAVMAALTLSGLLHQLPRILMGRSTSVSISIGFFYWIVNGLAIYLVIKIPKIFPQAIERLKLRTSLLWSLAGIILTSAFYATLIGMRELASWAELMDYFSRLFLGHAQGIS
jgi:D-alanyl-lipoteichoic acid acyltransferase DltB (MBOAT superfamily)